VPDTSFNVWTSYRLPFNLTLGGGAQFTAGYYFTNTNALTTANAAAVKDLTEYWLYSMMGSYRVNEHISLQINGMNLSNAKYVERGYSGHFLPGPGRAVQIGPVINF
jgi:catecholate siderophore receptor